jgi:hypothetical protein
VVFRTEILVVAVECRGGKDVQFAKPALEPVQEPRHPCGLARPSLAVHDTREVVRKDERMESCWCEMEGIGCDRENTLLLMWRGRIHAGHIC